MQNSKTIIVSNRLPIKIEIKKNQWQSSPSEGGLATGLSSIFKDKRGLWIGWPGATPKDPEMKEQIDQTLRKDSLIPIFLSASEVHDFYEGFSNQTLWPLCHYFPSYASFNEKHWRSYEEVNQRYADEVLKVAEPDDTIWIHDYQLMLVPNMIRQKLPEVRIGYFHHIPFPSYEVFRQIPWRDKLLTGLMGADLIGFHTHEDVRHFISAILRILDVQSNMNIITSGKRLILAESFPMGIDYDKFHLQTKQTVTQNYSKKIKSRLEHQNMLISIDRLDYSKGILQRLTSFNAFLKNYPEFREKVVFFQLIIPSRDKVWEYDQLKQEIDKQVSHINSEYSTLSWQPIQYFYRSWSFEILSALYYAADIALVTPMRDGMNLVCKEFVASKSSGGGVLILSEMAGASKELTEAIIVNPNDVQNIAAQIRHALLMSEAEKDQRMAAMQQTIEKFNIHVWVNNFLMRLDDIKQQQKDLSTNEITSSIRQHFMSLYKSAHKRIIFLDYDGTLAPFKKDPIQAVPSEPLMNLLAALCADQQNQIVIISGRNKETLENWMGKLPLDIIAEHGAWSKKVKATWVLSEGLNDDWKQEVLPILQQYASRTPGSFVEKKDYSLAWHYRKVETALGDLRAKEIAGHLKFVAADLGLQILEGRKVIEIKSAHINKGTAVEKWLKEYPADFQMAIGDDMTDEDTFKEMPETAITIKVGDGMSQAKYHIHSPEDVLELLQHLVDNNEPSNN